MQGTADFRQEKVKTPIKDGRFEYKLQANEVEVYALIFKEEIENGRRKTIDFLAKKYRGEL